MTPGNPADTHDDTGRTTKPTSPARELLSLVLPGIGVGIASAVSLLLVTGVASRIEDVVWSSVPVALGIDRNAAPWIVAMLTLSGVLTAVILLVAPGHAGPDPATTELTAPPLPPIVLPGLVLVLVVTLAGGVSLGPENPIIAVNAGLAVAVGLRLRGGPRPAMWAGLAVAGTLGAMFGTPLAAALMLSEMADRSARPLWDRMFGPLIAAVTGALVVDLLGGQSFALKVAPYLAAAPIDLVTGCAIAATGAALGMLAIFAFPVAHAGFHRLGGPAVSVIAGGVVLGLLGAVGGPITLFKGLEQMQELSASVASYAPFTLAGFAVLKFVAVVVASASGFRGGRIFPSVFAAVALGLAINAAWPQIPEAVALAGALVGVLTAVTRSGWMAIFMAVLMVGSEPIVPLACVMVLPAWLIVTGRPEMVVRPEPAVGSARA
jgi:H+/Cl- antiporter ClcA